MAAIAAQNNVYSTDKAPATIDELLNIVEDKSDIHFAAADVMFSDLRPQQQWLPSRACRRRESGLGL
jgi:hypothetical protein